MIHKMYSMMKYIPAEAKAEYIEISPYGLDLKKREIDVVVLDFTISEENEVDFEQATSYQYSKKNNLRWFYYAPAKAQATPVVPTVLTDLAEFAIVMEEDSEENISEAKEWKPAKNSEKFLRAIKNNAVNPSLTNLHHYVTENFAQLAQAIDQVISGTQSTLKLLTVRINNKFIGESEYYQDILVKWKDNYYQKYYVNKKQVGSNQRCSICQEIKEEVWGSVSTFNFYASKTELAPLAGGFKKEKCYLNYPVCGDCAQELDKAKFLLQNYMAYKFCGFNYFIIPEFIMDIKDNQQVMEFFYDDSKIGEFRLKHGENHIISSDQKEILDILSISQNSLNYSLVFWEESQAKFSLLLSIEGVYPSQFREIFEAKRKADEYKIFHNLKGLRKKGEYSNLTFMFENLKVCLPIKSKKYGDFSKNFLEIVGMIFRQKPISYKMLIERFMLIFRKKWANEDFLLYDIEKMINSILFLYYLKLIDLNKQPTSEVTMEEKYQQFLTENEEFLNSDAKRGLFLFGVLTQFLLDIQHIERDATPFRKQLNSLKLSPAYIRKLYPQVIEKFEQYDKNYYRKLETTISELFLTAKMDDLTNDEISFYFTTGMTLANKFRNTKKDDSNEEENHD